jgi:outer membrane lipoprotein SlyB
MKWLKVSMTIAGACLGTFFGWLSAKDSGHYVFVFFGAFFGTVIGEMVADTIDSK